MPVHFSVFDAYPDLAYGFSARTDGPMKVKKPDEIYLQRRAAYFNQFGISLNGVVAGYLIHGTSVIRVGRSDGGSLIPDTDALFTIDQQTFLSITAADCFPIYIFDPTHQVVALVHAGWRGIVDGILSVLIKTLVADVGSHPADLRVGIGPGLRVCHFRIQEDVRSRFPSSYIQERGEGMFVDLPHLIMDQLKERGVDSSHIEDVKQCTYCLSDQYFSYRRDQPAEVEAMLAFIGLREPQKTLS